MDQRTIDTYNILAHDYDQETIDFWASFPTSFLDAFASRAQGRVLDIGSGPARDALLLKERGLEVVCLDASGAMIELSRSRGFESIVGDFLNVPFSPESFGGVWAYTALLHISKQDIHRALGEISRVLAGGGVLGLGLIEGEGETYRESSGVGLPRLFSLYRKDEIEGLLREHGFEILVSETFKPASRTYLNIIARKS